MTRLTYTNKVLPLFTFSLLIASLGAYIGMQILNILAGPTIFLLYIVEFILLFLAFAARRKRDVGGMILFAFVFVTGVIIGPTIDYTLQLPGGASIVFQAFGITTVVFGALSYYAYLTGDRFSRLGGFLFVALIGIIIASLLNLFLNSSLLFLVVDIAAVIIFSGYILYDTGRILNDYDDDEIYLSVLSLYIDFLNLFINILELLGIFRRRSD